MNATLGEGSRVPWLRQCRIELEAVCREPLAASTSGPRLSEKRKVSRRICMAGSRLEAPRQEGWFGRKTESIRAHKYPTQMSKPQPEHIEISIIF